MKKFAMIIACLLVFTGCQRSDDYDTTGTGTTGTSGDVGGTTSTSGTGSQGTTDTTGSQSGAGTSTSTDPGSSTIGADTNAPGTTLSTNQTGSTLPGAGQTGTAVPGIGAASDQTLGQRVRSMITTAFPASQSIQGLQVSASGGTVTLQGSVNAEQDKQRLEDLVKQVPGVQSVNNQLQVQQPGSQTTPGNQPPSPDSQNQNQDSGAATPGQNSSGNNQ